MGIKASIGVSSCLLGQAVRYDGGHKFNQLIQTVLSPAFELVPICPEVAIGLGIPRPPIQIVKIANQLHARGVADPLVDVTQALEQYAHDMAQQLPMIQGYIFKARSPSCGFQTTPVYNPAGLPVETADGIYAHALLQLMPGLPVIDEERFATPTLREAFLTQIENYAALQKNVEHP